MSAHTHGPWSVITLDDGFQFIANDETKVTVCLAPELPLHNGVKSWPDNARLIAAAPDLLQACKRLLASSLDYTQWVERGMDTTCPPSLEWSKEIEEEARAAIAKATRT